MNDTVNDNEFVGQRKPQDPWKRRRGARGAWIAVTFIVAALVVTVAIIQGAYHRGSKNMPVLPEPRKVASAPAPAELSVSFREVAKAVKPAVVYVNVVERADSTSDQPDIFGLPAPGIPRRREGAGSGFIVTEDGYILTNNHVVGGASKIDVTLADGRKFKAEVVGKDAGTDLAVIKIDAVGLPVAVLGNSDEVQQGDWVLALGSPFGLQQTLTAGIVSATGRELRDPTGGQMFGRFIQTDASINPGNSGGPLVNMQGEVVGINTMILTGSDFSRGSIGIGFAIASSAAREVFPKLVKGGKVARGYLGVMVTDLDSAKARAVGLEPKSGVFVGDVPDPNSPAGKAGLQPKDVITAFDGKPVKAAQELTDAVASTPVGQQAKVDFIRNGQPQAVTVELAERPTETTARSFSPRGDEEEQNGPVKQVSLGIQARTVTPDIAERMKPKLKRPTGALVIAVQPNSPAAEAGVLHGDVIRGFDRSQVHSVEDLVEASKSLKVGEYMLEVERKGQLLYLTVTIE